MQNQLGKFHSVEPIPLHVKENVNCVSNLKVPVQAFSFIPKEGWPLKAAVSYGNLKVLLFPFAHYDSV
jgi:hypothetical protein